MTRFRLRNRLGPVPLMLAAAGLGLLLVACDAGSTLTPGSTGPSAARSDAVAGTVSPATATEEGLPTAVPVAPEAAGVEDRPEVKVPSGPGAEGTGSTDALPTETPRASSRVSKNFEIDFRQFDQRIPRDAIFPFYDPEFVSADGADLDDGELVIGVEINGESRAYPVGPLNYREMVNDRVGGVPILVTW